MTAYFSRIVPLFEEYITGATSNAILDGSGDTIAGIFKATQAGTLDKIESWVTAITGTSPTYDARLESLSAGLPSGSLIAANTNLTWQPSGTGLQSQTLTASRVVAINDLFAAVIRYSAGTINASNAATFKQRATITNPDGWMPRAMQDLSAGSWSYANSLPTITPRYSDGSYPLLVNHTGASTTRTFSNASNPKERGNRFTSPHSFYCHGARIWIRKTTAGANFDVILYDPSDSVLASASVTANNELNNTSDTQYHYVYFSSAVLLTSGLTYRLAVAPTTANTLALSEITYSNADARKSQHFEQYTTTKSSGNVWSDDTTSAHRITPLVDDYAAGAAGGLMRHPGMVGGLAG